MRPLADTTPRALSAWLVNAVARRLELEPSTVRTDARLRRYGLDSLAEVELRAVIEEHVGVPMPATLFEEAPCIDDLCARIEHALRGGGRDEASPLEGAALFARLREDAVLPEEIRPSPRRQADPRRGVLLTGATGFLGVWLLRALARESRGPLFCLVRAENEAAGRHRILAAAARYGVELGDAAQRLVVVPGDLELPRLGLSPSAWDSLAEQVDSIIHGAAAVNWTASYRGVRDANVTGTIELLRLACAGPASFHFVSSLGTLTSTRATAPATEGTDTLAHVEGIALGYFQSKCVAEALVREAGRRGLATSIHRPALLWGDRSAGACPDQDLLTVLVRGCVEMGVAPDLDWNLEVCPVDAAADAMVALALHRPSAGATWHVGQSNPRHWRELVLALNVFGHRVTLAPFSEWRTELHRRCRSPRHPLFALRSFFDAPAHDRPGLYLPELFERRHLVAVDSSHSVAQLEKLGVLAPGLTPGYLERVIRRLEIGGRLPESKGAHPRSATALSPLLLSAALRAHLGDAAPRVARWERLDQGAASISGELTGWLAGGDCGVTLGRLHLEHGALPDGRDLVCAKVKARDDEALAVGEAVAWTCNRSLGEAFARFGTSTELAGSRLRELGVYQLRDPRLERHRPAVYGLLRDDGASRWLLALEHLAPSCVRLDTADDDVPWTTAEIEAVLRGVASVHAVGWGRAELLRHEEWLGQVQTAASMQAMGPLLETMADHLATVAERFGLPPLRRLQRRVLDELPRWRDELERLPQTLIHNDFNPRNLALRRTDQGLLLCAFDWEVATLGVPQHDVMEFLCFALGEHATLDEVRRWLELHRVALEQAGACAVDDRDVETAARLSLRQLLVNRWPVYAMVHSVREQRFLPRVLRTWSRLVRLLDPALADAAQEVTTLRATRRS